MQRTTPYDQLIANINAVNPTLKAYLQEPPSVDIRSLEENIDKILNQLENWIHGNLQKAPMDLLANFTFNAAQFYLSQLQLLSNEIRFNYKNMMEKGRSRIKVPVHDSELKMHSGQAFCFNPNLLEREGSGLKQKLLMAIKLTGHYFFPHSKQPGFLEQQLVNLEMVAEQLINDLDIVGEQSKLGRPVDRIPKKTKKVKLEVRKASLQKEIQAEEKNNPSSKKLILLKLELTRLEGTPPLTDGEKDAEQKELELREKDKTRQLRPNLSRTALENLALGFGREKALKTLLKKNENSAEIQFEASVRALCELDIHPFQMYKIQLEMMLATLEKINSKLDKKESRLEKLTGKFKKINAIENLKTKIETLKIERNKLTVTYENLKGLILNALTLPQLETIAEDAFQTRFDEDDVIEQENNENIVKEWWKAAIKDDVESWTIEMLPAPWFKEFLLKQKLAFEQDEMIVLTKPGQKRKPVKPRGDGAKSKSIVRKNKPKPEAFSNSEDELKKPQKPKQGIKRRRADYEETVPLQTHVPQEEPVLKKGRIKKAITPSVPPQVEEKKDMGPPQFSFKEYKTAQESAEKDKNLKKARKKPNELFDNYSTQEEFKTFIRNILRNDRSKAIMTKLNEPHKAILAQVPSADSIDVKDIKNTPFDKNIGWGLVPLAAAAIFPNCTADVIEELIKKGADINFAINNSYDTNPYNGCTILMLACLCNNQTMKQVLFDKGVNIRSENNKKGPYFKWTAFEFAVLGGHLELVKQLLNFHVLMDPKNGNHLWESALNQAPIDSREPIRAVINRYYEERDSFLENEALVKTTQIADKATAATQPMNVGADLDSDQNTLATKSLGIELGAGVDLSSLASQPTAPMVEEDDEDDHSFLRKIAATHTHHSNRPTTGGLGLLKKPFSKPPVSDSDNESENEDDQSEDYYQSRSRKSKKSPINLASDSDSETDAKDAKKEKPSFLKKPFSRSPSRAMDAPRPGLMLSGSPKLTAARLLPKRALSGEFSGPLGGHSGAHQGPGYGSSARASGLSLSTGYTPPYSKPTLPTYSTMGQQQFDEDTDRAIALSLGQPAQPYQPTGSGAGSGQSYYATPGPFNLPQSGNGAGGSSLAISQRLARRTGELRAIPLQGPMLPAVPPLGQDPGLPIPAPTIPPDGWPNPLSIHSLGPMAGPMHPSREPGPMVPQGEAPWPAGSIPGSGFGFFAHQPAGTQQQIAAQQRYLEEQRLFTSAHQAHNQQFQMPMNAFNIPFGHRSVPSAGLFGPASTGPVGEPHNGQATNRNGVAPMVLDPTKP